MKAGVVTPGQKGSARVMEVPEPESRGRVVFRTLAVGICGTDREIDEGLYGEAPPGDAYLILGHEALGEVVSAPDGSGFAKGDRVVPVVRRPCGRCVPCSERQWDMCETGDYTERGIKGRHGYLSERASVRPEYLVKVPSALGIAGVLTEPTTVVAKAIRQVELAQRRLPWTPHQALVLGAGPIGLLASLVLTQKGLDVTVVDRAEAKDPKAEAAVALGAHYLQNTGDLASAGAFDLVVEATGYSPLIFQATSLLKPNGSLVLTGVTGGHHRVTVDSDVLNQALVLENQMILGSVNAAFEDYVAASAILGRAHTEHPGWLDRLISRRIPLDAFKDGLENRQPGEIKVAVDMGAA